MGGESATLDIPTQTAAFIGSHFAALYAAACAALLLFTAAVWALRPGARRGGDRPPIGPVQLSGAVGLLSASVIAVAALVFGVLSMAVGGEWAFVRFDVALNAAVGTGVGPGARRFFAAATRLADTLTLTLVCVTVTSVLLWQRRWRLALFSVCAVAGNGLLNTLLKALHARDRPVVGDLPSLAEGWSFPSGHSSGAVVTCGMLVYVASRFVPIRWHLALLLLAAGVAFTVACSRIVLQVHYASDVLAGLASGSAWFVLCLSVVEWQRRHGRA